MKHLALLCAIVHLLSEISVVHSKGDYAIVFPKWIRPQQDLDVCVIIMKETGSNIKVKVSLVTTSNKTVLAEKQETFKPGTENTITLKIPKAKDYSYRLIAEGSGGISFSEAAIVNVIRTNIIILIQTDKAIYQPGQKVLFRVMGLNVNLKPYTGTFTITITDKSGNKLRETKESKTDKRECECVYSDEFQLADEPPLGNWRIGVKTETGETTTKTFTVEEYVLPKVEVKVLLGSFYHHTMNTVAATIQAKYTFGQPVKGKVVVKIHFQQYSPTSFNKYYQKLHKETELENGEAKVILTKKEILSLYKCPACGPPKITNYPYSSSYIVFNATVTESITHDKYNGDNRIQAKRYLLTMKFLSSTPKNYKPGMLWTGFIKLTRADGSQLLEKDKKTKSGRPLKLEVHLFFKDGRFITQKKEKKLYDITDDGVIMIQFLSKQKHLYYVDIDATYPHDGKAASGAEEVVSSQVVEKHVTKNRHGIQVSMEELDGALKPSRRPVKFEVQTTESISSFYYHIISKRRIIKKAKISASGSSNTFTVLFDKTFAHEASPSAKMVVWYISDKELLVDSIQIAVNGTFINDVSLTLSKEKVKPGEQLTVTSKTDPESCVGLLAVDKSVTLLKQGNDITRQTVTDQIYIFDNTYRRIYRKKRSYIWWYPVYIWGSDPAEIINNAGLYVLTDAYIHNEPPGICFPRTFSSSRRIARASEVCLSPEFMAPAAKTPSVDTDTEDTEDTEDVRDVFPETWLWMNLFAGKNGMASTNVEAPDTITSWVFSAFSINKNSGLGIMDETTELIVFKSCFTDLRLPFSAIRHEILELRAVVFNYLDTKQTITVTLMESDSRGFYAEGESDKEPTKVQKVIKTVKIPANDGREVNFFIKPVKLGNLPVEVHMKSPQCSDALRKKLLVEAEGEPCDYSKGLFYGLNNEKDSDIVKIVYPPDVVKGSERILITAIGDVMGPSIKNLDHLIRKPYGCGEQNMVTFAPNIYVLDYITAAGLGSQGIQNKARRFMEIGYQRELTFQRYDGSFSAFGPNDKSGSLWMTAFVIRCFQQAKTYIGIDQRIIDRAVYFILRQQQDDGSFKEPIASKVTYSSLQGGVSKGVSLTAYVAKVLREVQKDLEHGRKLSVQKSIGKAQQYLESRLDSVKGNAYVLSLTCYFLCDISSKKAGKCLEYLENLAIELDGKVHWENKDRASKYKYWRPPYLWPRSNSVEMTAYALLTYCLKGETDKAAPVARWLSTVRTSYGGYSSTQDTVVGLQALATYAAKFPSSSKHGVDVKLSWKGGMHSFKTIKTSNSDIFQQFQFPSPGSLKLITVRAEGTGTALVQINVFFNKKSSAGRSGFTLTLSTVITDLLVKVKVCVVYNLEQSGMVVIEMNMLTSYLPALHEIMGQHEYLKKVEFRGKRLVLYFDEITSKKVCVTIKIKASTKVKHLKPALCTVYSYYESNIRDSVLYLPRGTVTS